MSLFKWSSFVMLFFLSEAAETISLNEAREEKDSYCLLSKQNVAGSQESINLCYRKVSTALSWEQAKGACQGSNSHLASVHSFEELNFLRYEVLERYSDPVWIGLNAKGLDSSYEWEDGTALDYVNWNSMYVEDASSNIETCLYLDPSTGYFGQELCSRRLLSVCKFVSDDLLTTTVLSTTAKNILPQVCPDGWYMFGDKCYRFSGLKTEDKTTWTDANRKCLDIGATLVSIHSKQEQDFLFLIMAPQTDMTWIGFREVESSPDRAFHWSDGSPVDFTYWDVGQPNNYNNLKEQCANIRFRDPHSGKWNDAECDVLRQSYVCQIHIDPKQAKSVLEISFCTEPKGWLKLGSSCYKVFSEDGSNVTWIEAQSLCKSFAGNLASVRSHSDTTFLRYYMEEFQGHFWIGIRNEGRRRKYAWITRPTEYSNWAIGEPYEVSDQPNCVVIDTKGTWIVRSCDENHPFICEVTEGLMAPEQTEVGVACPNSSLRWTDYGGRFCYIMELRDQVMWNEAAHHCFQEGGFLASFHSLEEVNLVLKQVENSEKPLYIGLGQKHDGDFGWVDRSAVDFVNWEPGQPTSHGQMCVKMISNSGKWTGISCETKMGYICSTPKVSADGSIITTSEKRSGNEGESRIGPGGIIGIIFSVLLLMSLSAAIYFYLYPSMRSVQRLTASQPV